MFSLVLHCELLITALSVVCFGFHNLYRSINVRSTVFLKHRTNRDNVRCAVRSFAWPTILRSSDPLVVFDRAMMRSLVGMFLPLFCVVDLGTSNGLMPSDRELMMLSRLLIVPGMEHALQIIGVNLCSLVLRPRRSMVLQRSHIMNEPGIL